MDQSGLTDSTKSNMVNKYLVQILPQKSVMVFTAIWQQNLNYCYSFSPQFMGSRDDVAAKIESDTKLKIDEMNKAVENNKENVSILENAFMLGSSSL